MVPSNRRFMHSAISAFNSIKLIYRGLGFIFALGCLAAIIINRLLLDYRDIDSSGKVISSI